MRAHIVLAILLSGFAASMTDWFFGGVLFHKKYLVYPEIWRRIGPSPTENWAIGWSIVLGFVTCGAFVFTCLAFQVHGYAAAIRFAMAILLIAPVPLLITNSLFIKIHPLTVVAHSLGWLAKLFIAAAAVGWLLP
ncbi:MAG: hypothetical protein DMG75_13345 [Acidobacteria bacterium]|nr:MAG: hypothetical protein DMG75_13345 [Acidobacteriota bacterium]